MPRILGIPGPYWFFFYSFDCEEPMHAHVRRDRQHCKFWLTPVELAWNHGFSPRELNEIRHLVIANETSIIEAWYEHCSQR
jgi:hypothetical protein